MSIEKKKAQDPEYFRKYYQQHGEKIRATSREHYQRNRQAAIDRALQRYYCKKQDKKQEQEQSIEV